MFFLPIGLLLINPHICSNYKLAHMVTYITFLGWIPESDDKQRKKSSISKLNLEDGKLPLLLVCFFFFNPKRNFISSWSRSQRVSPPTKLLGSLRKVVSEKAMAPYSSTLAWKIPWTDEPGRLQSVGSLRVGHNWATSLSLFTFMHWRRKWQPTPVFLPGESQGQGSLVGCRLWGCTESDTTEAT